MRVEIAAVLHPGAGDHVAAPRRIGGVPRGDIAGDALVDAGHAEVLLLRTGTARAARDTSAPTAQRRLPRRSWRWRSVRGIVVPCRSAPTILAPCCASGGSGGASASSAW